MIAEQELLCTLALTKIPGIGVIGARNLLSAVGTAVAVFENRSELAGRIPGIGKRLAEALDCPEAFARAEKELLFAEKNAIGIWTWNDERYPSRLRECDDAPIVLFFRGNADLNTLRIINMVGTRKATEYGERLCHRFLEDLRELCPGVLVVSGLAYGIDIYSHRAALANGLMTVGVLAHGLDRIYPSVHRSTAASMVSQGGLLTEFMSGTAPDRQNFVRRNRIVAGMSDATIVVQSAAKGGGLITADIAQSYHRDCFAFPGRTDDEYSQGCNRLIRDNKAALIQTAEDFVKAMCWDTENQSLHPLPVQKELFADLSDEEQKVVEILRREGNQHINALVVEADVPVNKMNAILFELEMKGMVGVLAGGMYRLLG